MQSSESRTLKYLAKPKLKKSQSRNRKAKVWINIPLASTGRGINDGLGCLDLSKARSEGGKGLVISVGVEAANVDVAIACNGV